MLEQNKESIFEIQIDLDSRDYLLESCKWAKFLAIVGMVIIGLLMVLMFFSFFSLSLVKDTFSSFYTLYSLVYLGVIALYSYPVIALYRFSKKVRIGIDQADQVEFNEGLRFLKATFRYIGIMTIIIIAIYSIILLIALIGGISNFI
ncbi:MAG TPA: hypothetical protein DCF44_04020 [Chitinophagaceae bacterium]|nr:hypothetical protein [Chitinophagaceae bacterium]